MKQGAYAEYRFDSGSVFFLNGTFLKLADGALATYRWKCVELNETVAKLNISIAFRDERRDIRLSTEVHVNTIDRNVIQSNGAFLGKTRLWATPNPEKDEMLILWDGPPDKLVGRVIEVEGWSSTPQGAQRVFMVEGNGTILRRSAFLIMLYDFDTGAMIEGSLDREATLLALGIVDSGRSGLMQFIDTNINLGPRELWPEILNLLVTATPIAALVSAFVLVVWFRRRGRRSGRSQERRYFFKHHTTI
jgi:hypothetical protein